MKEQSTEGRLEMNKILRNKAAIALFLLQHYSYSPLSYLFQYARLFIIHYVIGIP